MRRKKKSTIHVNVTWHMSSIVSIKVSLPRLILTVVSIHGKRVHHQFMFASINASSRTLDSLSIVATAEYIIIRRPVLTLPFHDRVAGSRVWSVLVKAALVGSCVAIGDFNTAMPGGVLSQSQWAPLVACASHRGHSPAPSCLSAWARCSQRQAFGKLCPPGCGASYHGACAVMG